MSGAKGNARSSGYERSAFSWYVEPAKAVEALLDNEHFFGGIHDPACGGGNIPKVVLGRGIMATGSDIVDRGFNGVVQNFLTDDRRYDNIITNPPFEKAVEFTVRALDLIGESGKVAILQRLPWLEGTRRHAKLFGPGHLKSVWVFSSRISMPPGGTDIEAKGGATAYAWFVFDKARHEMAQLGWLP